MDCPLKNPPLSLALRGMKAINDYFQVDAKEESKKEQITGTDTGNNSAPKLKEGISGKSDKPFRFNEEFQERVVNKFNSLNKEANVEGGDFDSELY